MKIFNSLIELRERNKLLYYFGLINFLLFAASFCAYFIDDTTIMGINAWIKPMKFGLSVAIYSWTFAWLLGHFQNKLTINIVTWVLIITMLVENSIIVWQAAHGQLSHFNISSLSNGLLFATMGVFIAINTFLNAFVMILLFIPNQVQMNTDSLLAWRAGLIVFFIGSISGGLMISHMGHTFGATDGGPGLPFTNWSTKAGDMRIAHFFTLHGLQVIPLFAYWVSSTKKRPAQSTLIFTALYLSFCLLLHLLELAEKPLFPL